MNARAREKKHVVSLCRPSPFAGSAAARVYAPVPPFFSYEKRKRKGESVSVMARRHLFSNSSRRLPAFGASPLCRRLRLRRFSVSVEYRTRARQCISIFQPFRERRWASDAPNNFLPDSLSTRGAIVIIASLRHSFLG